MDSTTVDWNYAVRQKLSTAISKQLGLSPESATAESPLPLYNEDSPVQNSYATVPMPLGPSSSQNPRESSHLGIRAMFSAFQFKNEVENSIT